MGNVNRFKVCFLVFFVGFMGFPGCGDSQTGSSGESGNNPSVVGVGSNGFSRTGVEFPEGSGGTSGEESNGQESLSPIGEADSEPSTPLGDEGASGTADGAEEGEAETEGNEAGESGESGEDCVPDCGGKNCGDDGCGNLCGTCEADGDICTIELCNENGNCVSGESAGGPCDWGGIWKLSDSNPVLKPVPEDSDQGADNIYAPHVLGYNGQWWMWYGGQGNDGHDAIFLAFSDDLENWSRFGGSATPIPVLDHGSANHVNDPTVVRVDGTLYMYYTEAPVAEEDEIHLATSTDGVNWTKKGVVVDVGPPGSWESDRVGRPSVVYEEGEFRMWYDGQIFGVGRHVGYATSADGIQWIKHPENPIVLNEGAIDVQKVEDFYVMLSEGGNGTRYYLSKNRLDWQFRGLLFGQSGKGYDAHGQVTPHLVASNGEALAILFGGASDECWCKNRIALAVPDPTPDCISSCIGKNCGGDGCGGICGICGNAETCEGGTCEKTEVPDPTGGCSACLLGFPNCVAACQASGFETGECGAPGSTGPTECCGCSGGSGGGTGGGTGGGSGGCEGCLNGTSSCKKACQAAGFSSGFCAEPGSTDPGACCACEDDPCKGCLGSASDCVEACQAAGFGSGFCAAPGSTDPAACCACE